MHEIRVPVRFGSTLALQNKESLRNLVIARIGDVENGKREMSMLRKSWGVRFLAQTILLLFWSAMTVWATEPNGSPTHGTNIFAPASTPAKSIADLSVFVLIITGIIFVVVFALLAYSVVKFRGRAMDAGREPAQVYGSTQIELAWTIIPTLIVVVLFLATARVIHAIQDAPEPAGACPGNAH